MIKDIFEILKGGLFLEFKSDEGKINCGTLILVMLLTGVYIYYSAQVAVASIQSMHVMLNPPLSLMSCFIPVLYTGIGCFILMCLTHYSTRNLGNKIEQPIKKTK